MPKFLDAPSWYDSTSTANWTLHGPQGVPASGNQQCYAVPGVSSPGSILYYSYNGGTAWLTPSSIDSQLKVIQAGTGGPLTLQWTVPRYLMYVTAAIQVSSNQLSGKVYMLSSFSRDSVSNTSDLIDFLEETGVYQESGDYTNYAMRAWGDFSQDQSMSGYYCSGFVEQFGYYPNTNRYFVQYQVRNRADYIDRFGIGSYSGSLTISNISSYVIARVMV